jgi:hypothetical protein
VEDLLELCLVALVPCVWLSYAVERQAAQFLEAAGVLFLKGSAAFEEAGEVLSSVLAHLKAAEPDVVTTDSGAGNAGLEAVQQSRDAHIRVQDIVHALLCLRIVGRAPLFGRCGSCFLNGRGEHTVVRGRRCAVQVGIEAVGAFHRRNCRRRSHSRRRCGDGR